MRCFWWAAAAVAAVVAGSTAAPVAAAPTGCLELQGAVGPDGMCLVHTENRMFTVDMRFPDDYPDPQPLVDYLRQVRDGFVNVAEDPDAYNLPYQLDAQGAGYRSGPPTGGTRSVVFTVWQNLGGAHPQTFYQAFNWNVGTSTPITFDTLFRPGTQPLDVIYPEVNRYLQTQQGLVDPVPRGPGLDPANYQNFAITDDSLTFFFSQGELMAEAAGPVQATVPRAALARLLAL